MCQYYFIFFFVNLRINRASHDGYIFFVFFNIAFFSLKFSGPSFLAVMVLETHTYFQDSLSLV